jgi:hypothetical protein
MTEGIVPDRSTAFAMTKGIMPSNFLILYAISVIANEVKQSGKREAGDILREIITGNTNLSAFLDCFTSFAMTSCTFPDRSTAFAMTSCTFPDRSTAFAMTKRKII